MTKYQHYIFFSPFESTDFAVFADEASARRFEAGMNGTRRAAVFVSTTGFSRDELRAEIARHRAAYLARVTKHLTQASA